MTATDPAGLLDRLEMFDQEDASLFFHIEQAVRARAAALTADGKGQ